MYIDSEKPPEVLEGTSFVLAAIVYAAAFVAVWMLGAIGSRPKETVIPIDMTVVMHENPDGAEDEPPPEAPPPEPAPPEPEPPPPPEPKPVVPDTPVPDAVVREKPRTNAVETVKKEEKKEEKKKVEEKRDPKKEREERIARMRASTAKIKTQPPARPPRNNGRTYGKPPPNLAQLLQSGAYKPGARNSGLDASEEQRCLAIIKRAFYDRWTRPVKTLDMRDIVLHVQFGRDGRIAGYRLVQSSGDKAADDSVLKAAARVGAVHGLSSGFLERFPELDISFTVK